MKTYHLLGELEFWVYVLVTWNTIGKSYGREKLIAKKTPLIEGKIWNHIIIQKKIKEK